MRPHNNGRLPLQFGLFWKLSPNLEFSLQAARSSVSDPCRTPLMAAAPLKERVVRPGPAHYVALSCEISIISAQRPWLFAPGSAIHVNDPQGRTPYHILGLMVLLSKRIPWSYPWVGQRDIASWCDVVERRTTPSDFALSDFIACQWLKGSAKRRGYISCWCWCIPKDKY